MSVQRAIPRATYRLQFNKDFTFEHARQVVPYLARLGISHVYASPYLKARPGSTHGYDITDHNAFNPEIGDEEVFNAFSDELTRHGMGQILDFVPNHMGIGHADNDWWLDVLEWGEASPYAEYFDIDWQTEILELRGKVLLPVLGDHYGRILEAGELKLGFDAETGTFSVWYYDHRFPIAPGDYGRILREVLAAYVPLDGRNERVLMELEDLIIGFRDVGDPTGVYRRADMLRAEATRLKQQLIKLVEDVPDVADVIDIALSRVNNHQADIHNLQWLHDLLEAQHYRLAYWRVAAEEINYRRFFQINDLAGIRVELPQVFEDTHRLVFRLLQQQRIHGLRIDHVDGLFDPKRYLEDLQRTYALLTNVGVGNAKNDEDALPLYVLVEKILAPHERLREDWPVAGTTGYDFLNRVHGVFVKAESGAAMQRVYERFVGQSVSFEAIAYESKHQVMDFELASELRVLANGYNRLTEGSWLTRDYTLIGLRLALQEVVSCFPVYRTYVDASGASTQDRRDIDWAMAHAKRRSLRGDKTVFDFLQSALNGDLSQGPSPYNRREVRRLAMKVQQYTSPVAAKGVEDTAFYRYNRLISNNEVGGEPSRFGFSVSAFHRTNQDAAKRWPNAMLSTATHDTKRGEDARVRIDVLSEMPFAWGQRVRRWAALNGRRKVRVRDEPAPSDNDEYLFYQALVGAWPAEFHDADDIDPAAMDVFRERMIAYMIKAVREGKVYTSWINPDADYEQALIALITRALDVSRPNPFLGDFRGFHSLIATSGMLNGLSQLVLKLTVPGVPDIYRGCEFWDFSLVDPDNRRPVDFFLCAQRLDEIIARFAKEGGALAPNLLAKWTDAGVKQFILWRLLSYRQARPDAFLGNGYVPLETTGRRAEHLCAFLRQSATGDQFLVVVPRLLAKMLDGEHVWPPAEPGWEDTSIVLPSGDALPSTWIDLFTLQKASFATNEDGGVHGAAGDLLATFPVAVLVAGDALPPMA